MNIRWFNPGYRRISCELHHLIWNLIGARQMYKHSVVSWLRIVLIKSCVHERRERTKMKPWESVIMNNEMAWNLILKGSLLKKKSLWKVQYLQLFSPLPLLFTTLRRHSHILRVPGPNMVKWYFYGVIIYFIIFVHFIHLS